MSDDLRGLCHGCDRAVALRVHADDQPVCAECGSEFVERLDEARSANLVPLLADSGGSSIASTDFVSLERSESAPSLLALAGASTNLFSALDDLVDALVVRPLNGLTPAASATTVKQFKPPPASARYVAALPRVTLTSDRDVAALSERSCAVCMTAFECGEQVVLLACQHPFHCDCVLPWLRQTSTCPACRHQLPTDDAKFERRHRGEHS